MSIQTEKQDYHRYPNNENVKGTVDNEGIIKRTVVTCRKVTTKTNNNESIILWIQYHLHMVLLCMKIKYNVQ